MPVRRLWQKEQRMVRRLAISLVGLALVTGSLAAAGPAMAVSSAHGGAARAAASPPFRPGGVFHQAPGTSPVLIDGQRIVYSTNWSGYAVIGSTFTTVTASWTQNAVTCPVDNTDMSPWVGIDGYSNDTVEQTGSSGDCNASGTPVYYAWYEMYPRDVILLSQTVEPGDRFTGTVTHIGGKKYKLTLKDLTQGWTNTVTRYISAANDSAEAVMEMAANHLSDFGADPFTDVTVDGHPIGSYTSSAYTVEQMEIKVKKTLCDSTSGLSDNENFTVTWKNSC
jgi:hypothetical protein